MIVNFTKMHSLGNDFVVIDNISQNLRFKNTYIKKIANRNTGIGCDQIILIEPPIRPLSDFYYKIYNSNGKTAEQCLNGARCAARFVFDSGLINKKFMTADCIAGQVTFNIEDNQLITTNLGNINPNIVPIALELKHLNSYCQLYSLSVGNPHAIYIDNHLNLDLNLKKLSHQIYSQNIFPQGINLGFAKIIGADNIQLRVVERGVGETLSCGSNAVATFLVAKHLQLITNQATILFKLGNLQINLDINNNLIINGPTTSVFSGKFKI